MSKTFEKNVRIYLPRQNITLDRFREDSNAYLKLWKDFFNSFETYTVEEKRYYVKYISEIEVTDMSLINFYKNLSSEGSDNLPKCWIDLKIKRRTEALVAQEEIEDYEFLSTQLVVLNYIPKYSLQVFLEDLFIAFNLCLPGSFHATKVKIEDGQTIKELDLQLFGDLFELTWDKAQKEDWPKLQNIEFKHTWDWMDNINFKGLPVAKKPIHKALLTLLHLTKGAGFNGHDEIILISQTLESILVESYSGIRKTLEKRINLVLGSPDTYKKWLSKFYRFRSKIVHGTEVIYRENAEELDSSLEEELFSLSITLDRATAVLIALMQQLILANGRKFVFKEVLEIEKCT